MFKQFGRCLDYSAMARVSVRNGVRGIRSKGSGPINPAYKYRPGKSGAGMSRRGNKPREPRPGVYRPGRWPVDTRRVFTGLNK
ncbi:protein of unknown function [Methylocaldum szegediense]|uniref:Uncharacterized protein n=1 Tax=Methylocaldum szegediense TaxID=73780 RepID=A0ABN8XEJ8_9GAMM|nr:protein of unknown function [Methylocaldum szegediense]